MTTMADPRTDRLVDEYLRRLDAAAAHLQRSRRAELVAEIREHIQAALREEDEAGEAAVRNVLERLGAPEEIVEAAEPPAESPRRAGVLEIAALLALLVPLIGWVVGIVFVLVSQAWSSREKLVGVALVLLPIVLPAFGLILGAESGGEQRVPVGGPVELEEPTGDSGLGPWELLVLGVFGSLPSALYPAWRPGRRRPATR